MQHVPMKVVLGSSSIRAFVAAPKHFKVLGVVRMGQEFGLLATNEEGTYLRVNGSHHVALDTQEVQRALHVARQPAHHADTEVPVPAPAPLPRVVVRKRRRVVDPLQTAVGHWQAA